MTNCKSYDTETNLSHIRSLPPPKLAPLLIHIERVEDWDYGWDDEMHFDGIHEEYTTSDGQTFCDYEDALAHEIEWLNAERRIKNEESNVITANGRKNR